MCLCEDIHQDSVIMKIGALARMPKAVFITTKTTIPFISQLPCLILKIINRRTFGVSHKISGPTIVKLAKLGICRKITNFHIQVL